MVASVANRAAERLLRVVVGEGTMAEDATTAELALLSFFL
jgi:hypothetical protein